MAKGNGATGEEGALRIVVKPNFPPSPQTPLLERDIALDVLAQSVARARAGSGCTVAITGEAGIGKSSVVTAFVASQTARDIVVLWGASEPLQTARALGPLADFAHMLSPEVAAALREDKSAPQVFEAVLEAIRAESRPTLMILEDVHWADEGTLDFVRFLSRRAMRLPLCIVLTFRSDEVAPEHPLRLTLGDISGAHLRRIVLPPLSFDAIRTLAAQSGRDPHALQTTTGGNPFFITEVLAEPDHALPFSVRDAVLARLSRLSEGTRALVNLVSVVPGKFEIGSVRAILGKTADEAIQTCLHLGLLIATDDGSSIRFRHELARRATESALDAEQRMALHRAVLALRTNAEESNASSALHHAVVVNDRPRILELAQRAARRAARLGAHKQAAAHYATALVAAEGATHDVRAQLNESWSYEAGLSKIDDEVIAARHRAVESWSAVGNAEKIALNLRWLSRLHWYRGERALADQFVAQSIGALENAPISEEKAWGLSVRSQMYMLNERNDDAILWGERAIAMAERVSAFEVHAHALNNVGSALMRSGDSRGVSLLEQSLAMSLQHGFHEQAARAYTNVASIGLRRYDLALARRFALEGLAFDARYDLDSWTHYLEGIYANIELKLGHFEQAREVSQSALEVDTLTQLMRLPARLVLADIGVMSDGGNVADEIAALLKISTEIGEPQHIVPSLILALKLAWITGERTQIETLLRSDQMGMAARVDEWSAGGLHAWRHRVGATVGPGELAHIAAPFAMEIAGDISGAARAWRDVGDPVNEAMALSGGDDAQLLAAVEQLESLGATAFAQKLRNSERGRTLRKPKRGPYAAAKSSAFGLTAKEKDVLLRMANGNSNSEIAEDLFRSIKTVEHHASSVLSKLGAKSRGEAVAKARQLGLISP